MLSPSEFRELISGRQTGLAATALRGLLRIAEFPYRWAMQLRNYRYNHRRVAIHRVKVPVLSVGNLTLGGTGKTPLVQWIANRQSHQGIRVAIVSRGYGASADGINDEALELQLALPGVPHQQNRDRVAAAQAAIELHQAESIVLDDGFQHRRLARDLDIVLLDATEPFGFEHVFPRGTLREPLAGLARADVVVLSRADMLDAEARCQVRERVARLAPEALWCEVVHGPAELINTCGEKQPLSLLTGKQVAAFSAIGNPAGFRHTLATLDCQPVKWREFADHHRYTAADVESLTDWATETDLAICTRKDLVKFHETALGQVPLWAVSVELQFLSGQQQLEAKIDQLLECLR